MGSAIARKLHEKVLEVTAFNRSQVPLAALAGYGMRTSTDINAAIDGASSVIVVLSNYDAVGAVLDGVKPGALRGKLVINLTSGSASDAIDMATRIAPTGAEYLDGSIWVLPSMIGDADAVISMGGSEDVWQKAASLIKLLGGASFHAGEAVESGNVLEACFPGAFYMTAQNCFIESMQLASKFGIGAETISRSVAPSLRLLRTSLDGLIDAIQKGEDTAIEATMDVYLSAAKGYQRTASQVGHSVPFLDLLVEQVQNAVNRGQGNLGPSTLFRS